MHSRGGGMCGGVCMVEVCVVGRHPSWGVCMTGGMCGREGDVRTGETATEVAGTHPTGMHS